MLKKIKKYFLLIPLIMVLCFNVCVYGSVKAVDYSAYFHPWDDCPYDFAFSPDNPASISYDCSISSGTRDLYFYAVYMDSNDYDNYLNGLNYRLLVRVIDFYNPDAAYPTTKSENDYFIRFHGFKDNRLWSFSYDASTDSFSKTVSDTPRSTIDLIYFKDSGQIRSVPADAPDSDYFNDGSSVGSHFFMQYTNYPGFDLVNFENESTLDVSVSFNPELSGAFSRTVMQNGSKVTLDTLNFTVTNNSNFPIQYIFAIVNRDEDFFLYNENNSFSVPNGKVFGGNPSYVYVKDEWLYLPSGETKKNVTSTFAPSSWHYVSSKNSDSVTIGFNQMKLNIGVYYNVYVYAIRNDSNQVLCIPYNIDSWQYNEDYVIDFTSAELVYSSEFTILNPATFDPTANDGSYAFDIDDRQLFNRANGYIDDNGNVVIDRIDTDSLIGSSDSWGSQFDSNAWDIYYKNQNTVSSDIDQLSRNFSSFFRFVNKVFSYFPKNYQSIIILGLTSMVVLGLFKVLV